MPLRFFRRIRIAPGLTINVSKSGASVSVGPKGAKATIGRKGVRRTVGLPGTGVYYTTNSPFPHHDSAAPAATQPPPTGTGIAGFWARRSWAARAFIVVLIVLIIAALAQNNAKAGSPAIVPAAATALATPAPTPTAFAAATIAATSPAAPPPTAEPPSEAAPDPTADATPEATPDATPEAIPATLDIRLTRLTSPVNRGAYATLAVRTAARASCSIEVDYLSGASTAQGLVDKTASSAGAVSWTWKVGTRTTPGTWPISVSCYKGDVSGDFSTEFRVR